MTERKSRYELFLEEQEQSKRKRCTKCGKVKLLSEFHKHRAKPHGVHSACKQCRKSEEDRRYRDRVDRFWKFFWTHTSKAGVCLEWGGYYKHTAPTCKWQGKEESVRKLVYCLGIGEVPEGWRVIAVCKNTKCVRHSHLKCITEDEFKAIISNHRSDISILRTGKGHGNGGIGFPSGAAHPRPRAKLTEDAVRQIRHLGTKGDLTHQEMADLFGVTRHTIRGVLYRRLWTHVQ